MPFLHHNQRFKEGSTHSNFIMKLLKQRNFFCNSICCNTLLEIVSLAIVFLHSRYVFVVSNVLPDTQWEHLYLLDLKCHTTCGILHFEKIKVYVLLSLSFVSVITKCWFPRCTTYHFVMNRKYLVTVTWFLSGLFLMHQ